MRITRVTKIRGHRVFRDFSWPGDLHAFGQFNLIYGWNGCGKTTLSSLFAHIEKGTNLTEGEAEFEIDDDRKCAGSAIAGTNLPPVRVFNRDFINATITAAGERVEPIYYLGEDSIEKQAKADELKKKKEAALEDLTNATSANGTAEAELDRFCIAQAKVIKEVLTGAQSPQYNNYDKRRFRQSIAAMQAQADAQAAVLTGEAKEQLRKQKDAQPKGDLPALACTLPDFENVSNRVKALLERSVASETIDALAQDRTVSRWVQEGLALHSGEQQTSTCRFCSQPLTADRRAALGGHFNDAFAAFQQEIASEIASLDRALTDLNRITFPDPARAYDHLQPELTAACSEAEKAIKSAAAWLGQVRTALEAKRAAPFAPAQAGGWQNERPTPDALRDAIATVNAVLDKHNSITSDFRNEVNEACKKLEQHYVAEAWGEHDQLAVAVETAEAAIRPLQDEVNRLQTEIADIERDIIEHRKPADELNDELRAYLGRDELRFEVKDTGYSLTRAGKPISHLSEGERTAIAFLYFLKSLQDRAFDLADGVVVIDDPVSSLDANALFSAFGYMKERTKDCGQLFVLTHNFGFFRQVKNWFHHLGKERAGGEKRPRGRFFLLDACVDGQGERNSGLRPLDRLLLEYESEYHFLFRRVYDEANVANGPSSLEHNYGMPNIARRLVETFLAFRYPDCPGDLAKRLDRVDFDSGKKTRILRLLNTYSHSSGIAEPEHDPSVLAETRPVLADVLEMIKSVDPTHYASMEQLVNGKEAPS
ncbi:MAG: AAA family ATPase [Polyangiaceae bacterium]